MSRWFNSKKWIFAVTSAAALSAMLLVTACSDDEKKDDFTLSGEADIGKWCDYGPLTSAGGGCYGIDAENPCKIGSTQGKVVNTMKECSAGSLPEQLCDYGFGNLVPMTGDAECNEYGALVATDVILDNGASEGFYCDFGQPNPYGNGGCYFRPNLEAADNDPNGYNTAGDCDNYSTRVSMEKCIESNEENPCIDDPRMPHLGSGDKFCNTEV